MGDNILSSCEIGPLTARQRRQEAFQIRREAALFQRDLPLPGHPCNGDENRYPNKIGNFSKGLPHNQLGEVNLNAYGTRGQVLCPSFGSNLGRGWDKGMGQGDRFFAPALVAT